MGEGAKAASEAGVLGVPWVYLSLSRRGYLDDQEKRYGLGRTLASVQEVVPLLESWLELDSREWSIRRGRLLQDSVDVTTFMVDLIEGWPESYEAKRHEVLGGGVSS